MNKVFFLISIFILFTGRNIQAQTDERSEIVMVRITECNNPKPPSEIIISYGNGKTEKISLNGVKPKDIDWRIDSINNVLTRIVDQGYKLVSSSSFYREMNVCEVTSILFIKKEED